MRLAKFVGLLGVVASLGCETGLAPESVSHESTLDSDGTSALTLSVAGSRATGSGISSDGASVRAMTFSALADADGVTVGQYNLVLNGNARRIAGARGHLQGNVTCLRVVGNRAFIAGDARTDDLEAFPLPVGGVAIEVVDGGEGPGSVDEISSIGLFAALESANDWCATTGPGPTFQAEHGQVQVR
jgi:hypothetical protein